jgi:isoquinoline 1-oxidoreductase alpha subunit
MLGQANLSKRQPVSYGIATQGNSQMISINVNGTDQEVEADPATPLLWVLREHLKLTGTKFGCGMGQCGACTIHLDGAATYACLTPLSAAVGKDIKTIEGLSENTDHPLQKAWIDLEVAQCGYCQSGQIMRAAALLARNADPGRQEIVDTMSANLCRCGTYPMIIEAIEQAAGESSDD